MSKSNNNEDGEDDGDSAELEQKQAMDVDPTKSSVKYHYEEKCKLIKVVRLSKLKKEKGDLIDTPSKASLLFNLEAKSFHILIQLASTHTSLFSGLILPSKS